VAQPLAAVDQPFFPEAPPAREIPPAEAAARLWMVLEHQRAGRVAEALAGWEPLMLAEDAAHWREIGMAAAHLQAGDYRRADVYLEEARQLAPANPVLAYYMGILHLEQAAAVGRDAPDERCRRGSWSPLSLRRNGARTRCWRCRSLPKPQCVPVKWRSINRCSKSTPCSKKRVVPRVGDLLVALEADNFVGKAHHLLYALHLDRRELIQAELNLDMAGATGLATLYGYQDLADAYLADERYVDAKRALRKDLQANHGWVGRAYDRLAVTAYDAARNVWVW
jgi:tetratricopeptide (TPR) repeat protein